MKDVFLEPIDKKLLDRLVIGAEVIKNETNETLNVVEVIEKDNFGCKVKLSDGEIYQAHCLYICEADNQIRLSLYSK